MDCVTNYLAAPHLNEKHESKIDNELDMHAQKLDTEIGLENNSTTRYIDLTDWASVYLTRITQRGMVKWPAKE